MEPEFKFEAELWRHDGPAAWFFLTLPVDLAEEIGDLTAGSGNAFGSVPVMAKIGEVSWKTSIFRDRKRSSYLLPVKAAIRKGAGVGDGDVVDCLLTLDLL
mgnify:CR=1 FL=1